MVRINFYLELLHYIGAQRILVAMSLRTTCNDLPSQPLPTLLSRIFCSSEHFTVDNTLESKRGLG